MAEAEAELGPKMDENRAQQMLVSGTPEQKQIASAFLQGLATQKGREAAASQNAAFGGIGAGAGYEGRAEGTTTQRREDALKGVPPPIANQVKAIVEGRMPMPTGMAMRTPYWQKMMQLVADYEPGFDATQWRVRLDTRADFAKGNAARQIRSLNTLIKHLGSVWDAAETLDNMKIKMGNRVWNFLRSETGSKALMPWRTAATAAASEMATLLKGGAAPSEPEIKEQEKAFDINDSTDAQKEAILKTIELAFGRMNALEDQWRNAFRTAEGFEFLNPDAKKVLKEKLNIDLSGASSTEPLYAPRQPAGTIQMKTPDGQIWEVPVDKVGAAKQRGAVEVK